MLVYCLFTVLLLPPPEDLPLSLQQLFPPVVGVCHKTTLPSAKDRHSFFSDVLLRKALQAPPSRPRPQAGE